MANRGQSFVASLSEFLKNRLKIAILKFSIISAGEVGVGAVNTTGQTWLIITVVCGFVGWQKIMNRFLKISINYLNFILYTLNYATLGSLLGSATY